MKAAIFLNLCANFRPTIANLPTNPVRLTGFNLLEATASIYGQETKKQPAF